MMRKGKHFIWGLGCLAVQAFLFLSLVVLEVLADYKAGVMKHLYFKNHLYMSRYYLPHMKHIHFFVLLLVSLVIIFYCWNRLKTRKTTFALLLTYLACLGAGFYLDLFSNLHVHVYVFFIVETAIVLEWFRYVAKLLE